MHCGHLAKMLSELSYIWLKKKKDYRIYFVYVVIIKGRMVYKILLK